jgi:hypothetical protein
MFGVPNTSEAMRHACVLGTEVIMSNEPSIWALSRQFGSIRIGGGLVALGVLFFGMAGDDAVTRQRNASDPAMLWVAGCFALVGGLVLLLGVRRGRAMWRLSIEGVSCEATVTAVTPGRLPFSAHDPSGWVIHYRYQDPLGHAHEGHSADVTEKEGELWKIGDLGRVRFDPSRPSEAVWTGEYIGPPLDAESRRRAAHADGATMATPTVTPYKFSSDKQAAEFLVGKIMTEGRMAGSPLREIERRYLLFDEDKDKPDAELENYGDKPVDDLEERTIALLKSAFARDQALTDEREKYLAAREALSNSDIYISYVVEQAIPQRKEPRRAAELFAVRMVAAVIAAFALLAVLLTLFFRMKR